MDENLIWHHSTPTQYALADNTGRIYAKLFQKHECWWSFNYTEYLTLGHAKAAAEQYLRDKAKPKKAEEVELPWNT